MTLIYVRLILLQFALKALKNSDKRGMQSQAEMLDPLKMTADHREVGVMAVRKK